MFKTIPLAKLQINTGQVKGVPRNPRSIRDKRFEALKKSLTDSPEMLKWKTLLAFPLPRTGNFVVLAGNMRLRAMRDLDWKEAPCYVLDASTPKKKLAEYAIKDNIAFGQDDNDILANEWDSLFALEEWGMELPELFGISDDFEETESDGEGQPDDGYFQLSVPVTAEQRGKIQAAINKAKSENAIEHSGAALAFIGAQFTNG